MGNNAYGIFRLCSNMFYYNSARIKMKLSILLIGLINADGESPHDPEAMEFCQGT